MARNPTNPLEKRLQQYSRPMTGGDAPHGSASSKENLADWSAIATSHSQIAPRAKGEVHGGPPGTAGKDAPALPSTKMTVRDTAMAPKVSRKTDGKMVDKLMAGKGDLNYSGTYLPHVRRGG